MYQATQDIISKIKSVKAPKIYCKKGEFLLPVTNTKPIIVANKNEIFPVSDDQIKKADMNPQRLIQLIKEVADNPHINPQTFPYDYVTGITEDKPWEDDFIRSIKTADIEKTIKQNLIKRYENPDLR